MGQFIAVFDSGVGGVSVLRETVRLMPEEDYLYFGDSANAPYGIRKSEEVRALTIRHIESMMERGAKAAVIACNTATSAAVKVLREMFPKFPLVGIEPAVKPAAEQLPGKRILVMATPFTVREEKFRNLLARYEKKANFIPLGCPGLMEYVEEGKSNSEEVAAFLHQLLKPYEGRVDGVVLGCTHYPFVQSRIREVLGEQIVTFDGSFGTAKELRRRLEEAGRREPDRTRKGKVVFESSDPTGATIKLAQSLLES